MLQHSLTRTELLIGSDGIDKLKNSKVVVLGIGGVGSFTVEALARSGVGKLVLVDNDTICLTNLNRQIHATYDTLERSKVEVMKERVLSINKSCEVTALEMFITSENLSEIITEDVDYVVDAIDTITAKIAVAVYCENNNIKLISSMGTGNKLDPTKFKVTDVYSTKVCPLAKVMRYELRKRGVKALKVVYSEEVPLKPHLPAVDSSDPALLVNTVPADTSEEQGKKTITKRQTPGSVSFVPPVAGMIIASVVIRELLGLKVN
ncbi:tRNA threonylcarbamoyladenosine dehydratase [Clostridium polynesiense]|uniref:tRNA threonylcarbamoyladenosine dehydratase n=1 Tax=Clostridium polynesiense TaxID=1325933 RepID=UPI00058CD8E5|nr:tRNA threonylcarbamoyladenosine dehydratase [Clostridium polynesiense]